MLRKNKHLVAVDERKSRDQPIESVGVARQTLGVVTEQFHEREHRETSVLQFLRLTLEVFFRFQIQVPDVEITEVARRFDDSDGPNDLQPSQKWNGGDGGVSRRNGIEWDAGSDVTREMVRLGRDVSQHGEHANASVLQFGETVRIESFLRNAAAQSGRIPEPRRVQHAGFVLEFADHQRRRRSLVDR